MFAGNERGRVQAVVSVIFTFLAAIVILLRLVVRIAVLRNYSIDDGLITIAFCFSVALTALNIKEVEHGQGLSDSQLSTDNLLGLGHTIYYAIPILFVAQAATKLSILFLYLRFFSERAIRIISFCLIGIITTSTIINVGMTVFLCRPISSFWNLSIPGHCLNRSAVWYSNFGIILATEIATLILPMPVLSSLRLPRRQRFELMLVFGLGAVAVGISIARLQALQVVSASKDIARDNGSVAVLSVVELNVGIICASLPTLRSTIVRMFHALRSKVYARRLSSYSLPHGVVPAKDVELAVYEYEPTRKHHFSSMISGTTEIGAVSRTASTSNMHGILRSVTITTRDEYRCSSSARKLSGCHEQGGIWDGTQAPTNTAIDTTFPGYGGIWDGTQGADGIGTGTRTWAVLRDEERHGRRRSNFS